MTRSLSLSVLRSMACTCAAMGAWLGPVGGFCAHNGGVFMGCVCGCVHVAVCGFSDSDGEDDDMQAGFNALLGGGRLSKPPKVARTQVGTAALEATLASTVDESGAWIHPYRRPGAERPYKSKKPWEQHEPLEPPPIPNFGPNLDVNPDTGLVR